MPNRIKKTLLVATALAALALGGAALARGGDSDGADEVVTGPAADRATAAALRITDGGRANSVERDNEDGATWEVEVTRPDGKTVDVRLNEKYRLVVEEGDEEDESE